MGIYFLFTSGFLLLASGTLCLLKTMISYTFHYEKCKNLAHSVFFVLFFMPLLIYKPVESATVSFKIFFVISRCNFQIIRYFMCLLLLFVFHFLKRAPITCIITIISILFICSTYIQSIGEELVSFGNQSISGERKEKENIVN